MSRNVSSQQSSQNLPPTLLQFALSMAIQLETATNTRISASWCPMTFHGHPISPQSPIKHTKNLEYFTGLCVLEVVYQQRKCSTYHLNVWSQLAHRFGILHLSKKLKLLKMFSVVQQNLFLMTMYQITELVCLNSISCHSQCCMN